MNLPFAEELPPEATAGTVTIQVTARCGLCHKEYTFSGPGASFENRIGRMLREAGWQYHSRKYGWICGGCKIFVDSAGR